MLVLLLLLTACIPEAEAVHWYIWARDVWFRSPPLSLIKNGTTFHYPSQVLWLSQVQTDAQVRSVIVAEMWDAQGFEQIMHAWFLGFGTLALSVPWLFVLITSQWLLKVATLVILLHAFEKGAHQQMLSGVGPIPRRCHCAWCLLGAGLGVNLNYVSCDVMHIYMQYAIYCYWLSYSSYHVRNNISFFYPIKVLQESTKLYLVYNVLPSRVSSFRHSLQMFDHTRHT